MCYNVKRADGNTQDEFFKENIAVNSRYAKNLGDRGEAAAAEYLEKKGYTILNRNYYICHGEIDIIAKDGDCTVFVEVKTRRSDKYGSGLEAITASKKRSLIRAAETYAAENGLLQTPMRFDVILITGETEIYHIKNAEISY